MTYIHIYIRRVRTNARRHSKIRLSHYMLLALERAEFGAQETGIGAKRGCNVVAACPTELVTVCWSVREAEADVQHDTAAAVAECTRV